MWPFNRSEKRSLDAVPWGEGWSGGTPAGPGMTQEGALRLVPVWGAVRFLADNIAAMAPGLGLYKLGKGDIAERQPTPALFANPSIHGTLFDWLHKAVTSMALQGDDIGLITQRDYYNNPTMIEWLNPINVQTLDRAVEGPGSYVDPRWYWWGRPMDPKDLLHIPWFCQPWRVRGLSPIAAYATIAKVGLAAQEFAAEWFQNGGVPPGKMRNTAQKISPEDADIITARITRRIRTRQPLVYGSDWEYDTIQISPNEAKFVETNQMTANHIATIYGVPPHKIGGTVGDSMTYATVEQESLDTLTYTFRPWLTRYEYAFSTCFPRGYFVRFDTAEFIRVDALTRAQIDALSLGAPQAGTPPTGWKDRNEVRASYNLAPPKQPTPEPTPEAPTGGTPSPGTSAAAAEPITRSLRERWESNGHNLNGHHDAANRGAMKGHPDG